MKAHHSQIVLLSSLILVLALNGLYSQTIPVRVNAADVTITSSDFDVGDYFALVDNDPLTFWRSAGVNPAFIQFEFHNPQEVDSIGLIVGQSGVPGLDQDIWRLEAADSEPDLLNQSGTYILVKKVDNDTAGIWQSFALKPSLTRKIWRFTVQRTVLDDYVHVYELGLFKKIDAGKLERNYFIGSEIRANNAVVQFPDVAPDMLAFDEDLSTVHIVENQGNPNFMLAFSQKQSFKCIRAMFKDPCRWRIESADSYEDLKSETNSYRVTKESHAVPDKWDSIVFSVPLTAKILRFSFSQPDGEIKLAELQFTTDKPVAPLSGLQNEINLWEGWRWTNAQEKLLYYGYEKVSRSLVKWSSSDTNIATVDSTGNIEAKKSGSAIITANYKGVACSTKVNVIAPVRGIEKVPLSGFLSKPAEDCVYEMPVLIIHYIPTTDGLTKDPSYSPDLNTMREVPLDEVQDRITTYVQRFKLAMEEGTRFRKYKNPLARPSIGIKVVDYIRVYEPCPPGLMHCSQWSNNMLFYAIDFFQVFDRLNLKDYVEKQNVRQVWFWASGLDVNMGAYDPDKHRPENFRAAFESHMATPTRHPVQNGCQPDGLPVYGKTYTVICGDYSYPEFVPWNFEPFTHQFEWLWIYQNWLHKGRDKYSFWDWNGTPRDFLFEKFVGTIGRCGWTHTPPNTTINYGYLHDIQADTDLVKPTWCDIEDWRPDSSGQKTLITHHTWEDKVYDWPDGIMDFGGRYELQWFIYWMQSIPGYDNRIPYYLDDTLFTMSNWWKFVYDWDTYTSTGIGLWEPDTVTSAGCLIKDNDELSIYPNPAENILFVANGRPGAAIRITNLMGNAVWQGQPAEATTAIDVSSLQTGMYFLRQGEKTYRFIKY